MDKTLQVAGSIRTIPPISERAQSYIIANCPYYFFDTFTISGVSQPRATTSLSSLLTLYFYLTCNYLNESRRKLVKNKADKAAWKEVCEIYADQR